MSGTDSAGLPGWQKPEDSGSDYNVFWFQLRQSLALINIATYCEVVATYGGGLAAPPKVDVMPLVNQIDAQGNQQQQGIVRGLQVYRVQGGLNAVICDPQIGDVGIVVIADRDLSSVISVVGSIGSQSARMNGTLSANPGSLRRFSLPDGTFFPCVLGLAPNQYVWFKPDGIYAADKNGNSITMNGTGIIISDFNGNKITMSSSGIVITDKSGNKADLTAGSGEITINTHTLTQHKHNIVNVQSGGSTIPSNTPTG